MMIQAQTDSTLKLTIAVEGNGTVSKSPDKEKYSNGTEVTLTAKPKTGFNFKEWGGALNGSEKTKTIVMDNDYTVTTKFKTRYALLTNDNQVWAVNEDGSNLKKLADFSNLTFLGRISDNGLITQKLVYTYQANKLFFAGHNGNHDYELYSTNLTTQNQEQITESRDDNFIYFSYRTANFIPDKNKLLILQGSSSQENYEIAALNTKTGDITNLTTNSRYDAWPIYSPNNEKIIFSSINQNESLSTDPKNGDSDLYIMNTDGSNRQQLSGTNLHNGRPILSLLNNEKILFYTIDENYNFNTYTVNYDGSNLRSLNDKFNFSGESLVLSWSQNGENLLLYNKNNDVTYIGNIITGNKQQLNSLQLDLIKDKFDFAPDNNKLVIGDTSTNKLYTKDLTTGTETLIATGTNPVWSQDSSKILFNHNSELYSIAADGSSEMKQLTKSSTWNGINTIIPLSK